MPAAGSPPRAVAFAAACLASSAALAEAVVCEVAEYGRTHSVRAVAARSPYSASAVRVGERFLFRVVFQHGDDSVRIYTYRVDPEASPVLLHEGVFVRPKREGAATQPAFTGRQLVYESELRGELEYSCRLDRGRR